MFTITHVIGNPGKTDVPAFGTADTLPGAVDWCDTYGDTGDVFLMTDRATGQCYRVTVGHGMGNGTHVAKA